MPRGRKQGDGAGPTKQRGFRFLVDHLERSEALAEGHEVTFAWSQKSHQMSPAFVIRRALELGLQALEANGELLVA